MDSRVAVHWDTVEHIVKQVSLQPEWNPVVTKCESMELYNAFVTLNENDCFRHQEDFVIPGRMLNMLKS